MFRKQPFSYALCVLGLTCVFSVLSVDGQANSNLATVNVPTSFLFNGPPPPCPSVGKKLILTINSQLTVLDCHAGPNQGTGIYIGNNYKFGDIMYFAQMYSSTCSPKPTDCFNQAQYPANTLSSYDGNQYSVIKENSTSDVDSVVHTNLSPYAGVQVTQCFMVLGIERYTQTVSSNYVTYCIKIQSDDTATGTPPNVITTLIPAGTACPAVV